LLFQYYALKAIKGGIPNTIPDLVPTEIEREETENVIILKTSFLGDSLEFYISNGNRLTTEEVILITIKIVNIN